LKPLKFLRKAHNLQKKGATRVPKRGYGWDSSALYRKGNEYLFRLGHPQILKQSPSLQLPVAYYLLPSA
jgi:hypothetical protein